MEGGGNFNFKLIDCKIQAEDRFNNKHYEACKRL